MVAIDGKTLRGSYDQSSDQSVIQMVSAWATTNKLVLAQVKVDEKSNEITAIPELLKVLELSACLVTIDAIGSQKEIRIHPLKMQLVISPLRSLASGVKSGKCLPSNPNAG